MYIYVYIYICIYIYSCKHVFVVSNHFFAGSLGLAILRSSG
jgi:hypothetical protein